MNRSVRIDVLGTVQGVGYRPFVYRLAHECGVTGNVRNTVHGVIIEAHGPSADIDRMVERIRGEHPPLAIVRQVDVKDLDATAIPSQFTIESSALGENPAVDLTRDTATCDDCVRELHNPADRRYHHPFINCTNCGPRYTIIKSLPYDRAATTMASFPMCGECERE